jgi:hypothetical protein
MYNSPCGRGSKQKRMYRAVINTRDMYYRSNDHTISAQWMALRTRSAVTDLDKNCIPSLGTYIPPMPGSWKKQRPQTEPLVPL